MAVTSSQIHRYDLEGRFADFAAKICAGSCGTHHGTPPKLIVVCSGVTNLKTITFQAGPRGQIHTVNIEVNDDVYLTRDQVGLVED